MAHPLSSVPVLHCTSVTPMPPKDAPALEYSCDYFCMRVCACVCVWQRKREFHFHDSTNDIRFQLFISYENRFIETAKRWHLSTFPLVCSSLPQDMYNTVTISKY